MTYLKQTDKLVLRQICSNKYFQERNRNYEKNFQSFLIIACLSAPIYYTASVIQTVKPIYAASSIMNHTCTRYEKLLTLKTDSYQEMTISQFRENATSFLDTPENMKLLQKALEDNQLRFNRFTDNDAFFIFNTLGPLAYNHWQKNYITGGVEYRVNDQFYAELEFRAFIKIQNPEMLISEYEKAYSGLADTALRYLKSQKCIDLSNETPESTYSMEKKALKKLQNFASKINKKGNLKINVKKCMYGLADASFYI